MSSTTSIESLIVTVRDQRVILAKDLATLYGAETKRLNEQVRRNRSRFPGDFVFQLTQEEVAHLTASGVASKAGSRILRSQIATLERGRHAKYAPYAFTEHGAIMAANVLNTPRAVAMSVYVVRAFVQMRERVAANAAILKRLTEIDSTLLEHDDSLRALWSKLKSMLDPPADPPRKRIGFHAEKL